MQRLRWSIALICTLACGALKAEVSEDLPNIKYVGIVPVYWQGSFPSDSRFQDIRSQVDQEFPMINRDSKRFIFLNDSIIADHWSTPSGREKLVSEYELDAFMNLTVSTQADISLFTVRLLGPGLENYLTETERMPLTWLNAASRSELQDRLRKLTYRVLNRYPLDVFVTSLQGRYITLSSGREQNVFDGDELTLTAIKAKNRHPVDGSWLEFEQKVLGKAKIVESKAQSSIALITSLNSENAIRVGSGARVDAIASRRIFQDRPSSQESFVAVEPDSPIVVPASKAEEKPKVAKKPNPPKASPPAQTMPLPSAVDQHRLASAAAPELPPEEEEIDHQASGSLFSGLPVRFHELLFSLENENLSYGSAATMSSKFPNLLVNRASLEGEFAINSGLIGRALSHIRSGQTKKGSYFGFGLGGEMLYKMDALSGMFPSLESTYFGVLAQIESVGASGSSFGGINGIMLAPVFHMQGSHHIADIVRTFDYEFSLRYFPIAFGSAGVRGKTRSLSSGKHLELEAQAVSKGRAGEIEWGGLVMLGQGGWELSKGSLTQQDFRIGLLGRMKL